MKKAIVYSRISSLIQQDTRENQEKECRLQAKKLNAEVVEVFSEVGEGDDDKKDALRLLEVFIRANKEDLQYLIISTSKRLARSGEIASKLVNLLRDCHVELVDCSMPHLKDEDSYAHFIREAAEGKQEKQNISRTTSDGIKKKQQRGEFHGRLPGGFSKELEAALDPLNPAIKLMFSLAQKGFELKHIQQKLKDSGFKMSIATIRNRLENPLYAGLMFDNEKREYIKSIHPVIIQEDDFYAVQKIISTREQRTKRRRRTKNDENLPLRHKLICKKCGDPYTGSTNFYRCNKCLKSSIKNEILHPKLVELLNGFDYDIRFADGIVNGITGFAKSFRNGISELDKIYGGEIRKYEKELEQIQINSLKSENFDPVVLERTINFTNGKIQNLRKRKNALMSLDMELQQTIKKHEPIKTLGQQWLSETTEMKAKMIDMIFPSGLFFDGKAFSFDLLSSCYIPKQEGMSNIDNANTKINEFAISFCNEDVKHQPDSGTDYKLLLELYWEVMGSLKL